jgi:Coenzyme PQQ synthesis protein D (PqqD)
MTERGLPKPTADVVFKRVDQEGVLVNLRTNRIFTLTETGTRFWELLAAGNDRAEIERRLLDEYDVEKPALVAQIDSLVRDLAAENLVDWS